MKVSEELERAADIVATGACHPAQAIMYVASERNGKYESYLAFEQYVCEFVWVDEECRTHEELAKVMRECAKAEKAKETDRLRMQESSEVGSSKNHEPPRVLKMKASDVLVEASKLVGYGLCSPLAALGHIVGQDWKQAGKTSELEDWHGYSPYCALLRYLEVQSLNEWSARTTNEGIVDAMIGCANRERIAEAEAAREEESMNRAKQREMGRR